MPPPPDNAPTAADLMTPNPRTCSPYSTVLEAVMIFRDADCGAVPVLDAGKAVGVLTDRDVALALADHLEGLPSTAVSEIMTKDVISVPPDAPIDTIIDRFGTRGVRRLLVVDPAGTLVGILGWADVAPHAPDRVIGRAVTEVVEQD